MNQLIEMNTDYNNNEDNQQQVTDLSKRVLHNRWTSSNFNLQSATLIPRKKSLVSDSKKKNNQTHLSSRSKGSQNNILFFDEQHPILNPKRSLETAKLNNNNKYPEFTKQDTKQLLMRTQFLSSFSEKDKKFRLTQDTDSQSFFPLKTEDLTLQSPFSSSSAFFQNNNNNNFNIKNSQLPLFNNNNNNFEKNGSDLNTDRYSIFNLKQNNNQNKSALNKIMNSTLYENQKSYSKLNLQKQLTPLVGNLMINNNNNNDKKNNNNNNLNRSNTNNDNQFNSNTDDILQFPKQQQQSLFQSQQQEQKQDDQDLKSNDSIICDSQQQQQLSRRESYNSTNRGFYQSKLNFLVKKVQQSDVSTTQENKNYISGAMERFQIKEQQDTKLKQYLSHLGKNCLKDAPMNTIFKDPHMKQQKNNQRAFYSEIVNQLSQNKQVKIVVPKLQAYAKKIKNYNNLKNSMDKRYQKNKEELIKKKKLLEDARNIHSDFLNYETVLANFCHNMQQFVELNHNKSTSSYRIQRLHGFNEQMKNILFDELTGELRSEFNPNNINYVIQYNQNLENKVKGNPLLLKIKQTFLTNNGNQNKSNQQAAPQVQQEFLKKLYYFNQTLEQNNNLKITENKNNQMIVAKNEAVLLEAKLYELMLENRINNVDQKGIFSELKKGILYNGGNPFYHSLIPINQTLIKSERQNGKFDRIQQRNRYQSQFIDNICDKFNEK